MMRKLRHLNLFSDKIQAYLQVADTWRDLVGEKGLVGEPPKRILTML